MTGHSRFTLAAVQAAPVYLDREGKTALRPAIVNWRTKTADIDLLVEVIEDLGATGRCANPCGSSSDVDATMYRLSVRSIGNARCDHALISRMNRRSTSCIDFAPSCSRWEWRWP